MLINPSWDSQTFTHYIILGLIALKDGISRRSHPVVWGNSGKHDVQILDISFEQDVQRKIFQWELKRLIASAANVSKVIYRFGPRLFVFLTLYFT